MRIKHFLTFIAFVAFVFLNVFGQERDYKLELKDFTELKVNNPVNVEYFSSSDSAGHVYFTCNPSVAEHLMFSNRKSTLAIQLAEDYDNSVPLPTIKVYSSRLEKVENGADSTVRVVRNENVDNFKARLIGNGSLIIDRIDATSAEISLMTGNGLIAVVSGKVFKSKLTNVGTGTIQAGGLNSVQVKAIVSGTGSIDCCASEQLSIYGMGSGKVYYTGNPSKIHNRSMGVKALAIE